MVRACRPELLAAAALLVASPAIGFERQWHLGGGAGVATFTDGDTKLGPALGLHAAYGISDTFDLRAALLASTHSLDGERVEPLAATAGLAYKLDVLAWVPYAGLSVGYYRLGRAPRPGVLAANELGVSADLGLDYAVTRHFGVGTEFRFHGFLSDPFASLGDAPYFSALLRAEYRWGW